MSRYRQHTGLRGEQLALNYLTRQGYRVVHRNYRSGRHEVDLIMRQENVLVFVEVKSRQTADYGYPETFVSEAQQERIHLAAEDYVARTGWQGEVRFDIVAIVWEGPHPQVDHFEDAF